MFSSKSNQLSGDCASAGAVTCGTIGINTIGTRKITDLIWTGIMAYQMDTKKYITFEEISNVSLLKTEMLDFAGETSNSNNANTIFGNARVKGSDNSGFTITDGIIEIHHSNWDPLNNTNFIIEIGGSRNYGSGCYRSYGFCSHAGVIRLNGISYNSSENYMFYR